MERSKIPMLSRFDAISHVMPYYGQTHRAFFLLSSLCLETREKLDEFYDEFVTCMKEYWMVIKAHQSNQSNYLFLPNDLFVFVINGFQKEMFGAFIKLIKKLRDSKGWHFNSHYMHSKIKIRDSIVVSIEYIDKLYAYVDLLKSTQVILWKEDNHTSKFQYEPSTLYTNCSYALLILKRTYINVLHTKKISFLRIVRRFLNWFPILTSKCSNSDNLRLKYKQLQQLFENNRLYSGELAIQILIWIYFKNLNEV